MRSLVRNGGGWVRVVAPPGISLGVTLWLRAAVMRLDEVFPDARIGAAWNFLATAAAAWLAASVVAAVRQWRGDSRAAVILHDMRVRAGLPGCALFCVLDVVWATPAGTRVAVVDVRTGEERQLWLAEGNVPPASYVLVHFSRDSGRVLDVAAPALVAGARRHELAASRPPVPAGDRAQARRDRRAARQVVRAAESLTRQP